MQSITGFAKADTVAKCGYNSRRSIFMEATLQPTERPYMLRACTFDKDKEAMFQLEIYFEGDKGDVDIKDAPKAPRKAKGEPY